MASIPPKTECKATLVIDPWTASIASEAFRRGTLQAAGAAEAATVSSTTASAFSASTATAQPRKQPATSNASSVASKFNLPHADVLHLLRMCYYSGARHVHKASETAVERSVAQSPHVAEDPHADAAHMVEAREAKRHKAAAGGDSDAAPQSRRVMALKRLCNALGVVTQHRHLPAHNLSYAVASSRGWRVAMEDTYAAEVPLHESYGMSLFALYDGHGGAEVARYSALHMGRAIREAPSACAAFTTDYDTEPLTPTTTTTATTPKARATTGRGDVSSSTKATDQEAAGPQWTCTGARMNTGLPKPRLGDGAGGSGGGEGDSPRRRHAALREAFLSLDRQLSDEAHAQELMALANPGALTVQPEAYGRRTLEGPYLGPPAGSTASVALVGRGGITVAGVGDSRCILGSRARGVMVMSVDHKGHDAAERERVVRAGCWVSASGRVCGELDMSRALGDADMKQAAGLPPHLQAVTADPTVMHVRLAPDPHHQPTHTHQGECSQPDLPAPRPPLCGGAGGDGGGGRGGGGPGHEAQPGPASSLYGTEGRTDARDVGGGSGRLDQPAGGGGGSGEAGPSGGSAGSCRARSAAMTAADSGEGRGGGGGGCQGDSDAGQGDGVVVPGVDPNGGGNNSGCYLLLASDGLWNVLDTEAVHEFVMERLEAGLEANTICSQLCVEACVSERTAYDNVTVLLVQVHGVRPVGEVHVATSTTHIEAAAAAMYSAAVKTCDAGEEEDRVIVEVEVGPVDEEQRWAAAVGAEAQAEVGNDDIEMSAPGGSRMGCVAARKCSVRASGLGNEADGELEEGEPEEGEQADAEAQAVVQRLAGRLWREVAAASIRTIPEKAEPHQLTVGKEPDEGFGSGAKGSAAEGRLSRRAWREREGVPENEQPLDRIGDAMCSIWVPKPMGGYCSEANAMFVMDSKRNGPKAELTGRGAMAGLDEKLLEPSPMQQDDRIS
ncbi:hypothetical protein VaNZ11_000602 [Volvox africanus]|uniref:protein-serine/threonine phosphatase n=1 Tax=Volvox africanus TaxID=51714 RepID=A0ABQ5RP70_9CHLO|nr:hypothetical protein VaNZ11_000602 [Volvox africanus]